MDLENKKKGVFKVVWLAVSVILFISWPLSHWLYYDFYSKLLGAAPGTYQDSLIKMIGTCGLLPSLCLIVISLKPKESLLLIKMLSVFFILLAVTFVYLIVFKDFTPMEYLNTFVFVLISIFLPLSYKWGGFKSIT